MSGLARSPPMNGSRTNVPGPASLPVIASTTACCRSARVRSLSAGLSRFCADAGVDQGAPAVHLLLALAEPPARPLLAARIGRVRALELVREDRLRNVDLDAAERVDHGFEVLEVDQHDVIRLQARERLYRLERQRRAAQLVCRVDLVRPVARDLDAEIARDREIGHPVPAGIGSEEQNRVRAPRVGELVAVGAQEQDQRRLRDQHAVLRRKVRLRRLRQPRVRLIDAAAEREVAERRTRR